MKNNEYSYSHPYTVWETISSQLLKDIAMDVLKAGERVPSINELAKQYNVSANTAAKALEFLRDEDVIMKKRGIGFFVLPFAKQKVKQLLEDDIDQKIDNILNEAKNLGYKKEEILKHITEIWG